MDPQLLRSLNPAQLQAVEHSPVIPLQILAGPGSGKTRVLTARIAHLILCHNVPAHSICAVTFTNKAANEMRERLAKLIGKSRMDQVKMGTFHAICAFFLRKYGTKIGMDANFTVCDADETKKIIKRLMQPHKEALQALLEKAITLTERTLQAMISKAKSKGLTPEDILKEASTGITTKHEIDRLVGAIYAEYEQTLRKSNSLDFDDLLLFGLRLFRKYTGAVEWCQHVLVDEFQDTNVTQYEIMRCIGMHCRRITIVGDPDQSIYGWRSAEVENLRRMRRDFPTTEQIFLEQNYRSTGSILEASLSIVSQDKDRIPKTLFASHPAGAPASLRFFNNETIEATFVAVEIKRLVAEMGGMLRYGDFAILLRFNALSRALEAALQMEAVPYRILKGHRFFERMEVKDLLAYLQLVDNPLFTPAFTRAVNVPSRGVGEKTLAAIMERAEKAKLSPLGLAEAICDQKTPDTKPPVKRKLAEFVNCIQTLRALAEAGGSPAALIRRLLDLTEYKDHLMKTQEDWETRMENVQELITFASDVEVGPSVARDEAAGEGAQTSDGDTPLRLFLQASTLTSDGDDQKEADAREKVTISTCHAAKGLEWPVVIVPAVERGVFPFARSEDVQEERRLLYVACTRAQSLLYLSHVSKRKIAGVPMPRDLSDFVYAAMKQAQTAFSSAPLNFSVHDRRLIAKVLERPMPDEREVIERIAQFRETKSYQTYNDGTSITISLGVNQACAPIPEPVFQPSRALVHNQTPTADGLHATDANSWQHASTARPTVATVTPRRPADMDPPTAQMGPAAELFYPLAQSSRPPTESPHPLTRSLLPPVQRLRPPAETLHRPAPAQPLYLVARPLDDGISVPVLDASILETPSPPPLKPISLASGKRRLGMGRAVVGYPNKKFKAPT